MLRKVKMILGIPTSTLPHESDLNVKEKDPKCRVARCHISVPNITAAHHFYYLHYAIESLEIEITKLCSSHVTIIKKDILNKFD